MEKKYLPRIIDKYLDSALEASGAVLIEGAKWCGKTSTAKQRASSVLFMQDPDYTLSYLEAADTKPSLLLKGDTPRLIDEWQMGCDRSKAWLEGNRRSSSKFIETQRKD